MEVVKPTVLQFVLFLLLLPLLAVPGLTSNAVSNVHYSFFFFGDKFGNLILLCCFEPVLSKFCFALCRHLMILVVTLMALSIETPKV